MVWLPGGGVGRLLLGTLVPEEGGLRLRRTLSLGMLEQAGCWPVRGAEAVLAFSFARGREWYCESRPGRLVEDSLLRQLLCRPMLCRRAETGFELAVPFDPGNPVGLNTLLCLARVGPVGGRLHLIWCFDASGRPLTHKI